MAIIISVMILDMFLGTFFDILKKQLSSEAGMIFFIIISLFLFSIGQFFLMRFVKEKGREIRKSTPFEAITKGTTVIQYIILAIISVMIIQMIFSSKYSRDLIILATVIGTLPTTLLLGMLSFRLFSWYKTNKKNVMVLLLGLSAATGSLAALGNIDIAYIMTTERPPEIGPSLLVNFQLISSNITVNTFFYAFVALPLVISFLCELGGTTFILRHFSKKIGKLKVFLIVVFPLVSFMITITPSLLIPSSGFGYYKEDQIINRLVATISADVSVFVMALGYRSIAKSIKKIDPTSNVSKYMMTTTYGLILLSISYQAPVIFTTYPPFGFPTHVFLTVSSYVFSLGFYSSAISVSTDMKLRRSIRKSAEELELLDHIGNAQMEKEIQTKVLEIAKESLNKMKEETGIVSSMNDDEMKEYLVQVIQEIKQRKN